MNGGSPTAFERYTGSSRLIELMQSSINREDTVYRSKAVGEPPFMLALSAFHAIRDALADSGDPSPPLQAPATPEAILRLLEERARE